MGYCCSHLWQINKWKYYLMIFFFSVSAQTFDICNYYCTFEKETHAGTWVVLEGDYKQLLPYHCAKMTPCTLNHWWFLKLKQGRWCWLAESYAWYTKGIPTVPALICRKKMTSRRNGRVCAKGEAICFTFRPAGGPSNWTVLQMINFISCSVGWWVDLTLFLNHSMAIF